MSSELSNLVTCGSSKTGRKKEYLNGCTEQIQGILKTVTKMQRKKFERYGLVPVPVLEAMWHLGWLPGDKAPEQGMRILALTGYLRQGRYKSAQAAENGRWLYEKIMQEEVIGKRPVVKRKKFLSWTSNINPD